MTVIFIIATALVVNVGIGIKVYLRLRRGKPVTAVAVAIGTVVVLSSLCPIPTHGGISFLGELLIDDLYRSVLKPVVDPGEDGKRKHFLKQLEQRFKGILAFKTGADLGGGWFFVTLSGGESAWYERQSGLVWSTPLVFSRTEPMMALDSAKQRCRRLHPHGYWALPTEAERYQFWRAAGIKYLPHKAEPAMAYIVDTQLRMEVPSVSLLSQGNSSASGDLKPLLIRCVALGPGAPLRGYVQNDISLEQWNRFQISKLK
ncbi:MAG: hypothetical protein OEZ68_05120 [Gammaproteobacteria bacterium]|nr:hypothetical protein [Gammaproteobacteria bacterium]MDH5800170.1 hypothetical protein [Gammaproteobacteria bacterium]